MHEKIHWLFHYFDKDASSMVSRDDLFTLTEAMINGMTRVTGGPTHRAEEVNQAVKKWFKDSKFAANDLLR